MKKQRKKSDWHCQVDGELVDVTGNGQSKPDAFSEYLDEVIKECPNAGTEWEMPEFDSKKTMAQARAELAGEAAKASNGNGHHEPKVDPADPGLLDEVPETEAITYRILGSDFLEKPRPAEKEYIVDQIVRPGRLTVFHGPPSGGKSWAGLDMMVASALEQEWMGKKTKPAHWFYLDLEMDEDEMAHRFKRLLYGRGYKATQKPLLDRLSFTDYEAFPGVNLAHEADEAAQQVLLDCAGVDVLIIDSWGKAIGHSADENSATDANGALRFLKKIRDASGCAIVLIAHNAKGRDNFGLDKIRGSSAVGGDAEIAVQFYQKGGGVHVAQHTKHRPFSATKAWTKHNTFTIVDDEEGNVAIAHEAGDEDEAAVEPIDPIEEIKARIKTFMEADCMKSMTTNYIKKHVQGKGAQIAQALKELVDDGSIDQEKKGQANYYSLPGL